MTTAGRSSSVRPIAHQSLVDRVTDEMHRAILNGEIAPGSAVSIVDLCDQFAVSHIPVREALRRLESEGVVSLRPGRSALVTELSAADVTNTYELRKLIEGERVARAAATMTAERIEAAELALAEHEQHASAGAEPAEQAARHHAFHAALLEGVLGAADRLVLDLLWRSSARYLHLLVDDAGRPPKTERTRIAEHRELLELARAGDAEGLRESWLRHLDHSLQAFLAALPATPPAEAAAPAPPPG